MPSDCHPHRWKDSNSCPKFIAKILSSDFLFVEYTQVIMLTILESAVRNSELTHGSLCQFGGGQ
jgi:hypothetical protein